MGQKCIIQEERIGPAVVLLYLVLKVRYPIICVGAVCGIARRGDMVSAGGVRFDYLVCLGAIMAETKTKTCKHCALEYERSLLVCPRCGKKTVNNNGVFIVIAVLLCLTCAAVAIGPVVGLLGNALPSSGTGSSVNCDRYLNVIRPIIDRWDDANALASSTSRIAISGPLAELQSIRREAVALSVPSCADKAHTHLVAYMNATIEGYLAFASQDDASVEVFFDTAETLQDSFLAELAKFD